MGGVSIDGLVSSRGEVVQETEKISPTEANSGLDAVKTPDTAYEGDKEDVEEHGDAELLLHAPSLSQAGKTPSQMSQVGASIADYLNEDDRDGDKSSSSGELSDSAMQALMTQSSPSLLAKLEEEKREKERNELELKAKQEEETKANNSAPKVTIVRDIMADLSQASVSQSQAMTR